MGKQIRLATILQRYGLWLSLFIHLLLLLSFSLVFTGWQNDEWKNKPALDIPSYIYHEASANALRKPSSQVNQKNTSTDKIPLENKRQTVANMTTTKATKPIATSKNLQGVHLIGDKKTDEPLIKILGTVLSAHLRYPKIAEDFGLRGVAYVGFTLHPDGQVTGVELVKTSSTPVLDQAALAAVNAIAPVKNVAPHLNAARYLVIGFIFGHN